MRRHSPRITIFVLSAQSISLSARWPGREGDGLSMRLPIILLSRLDRHGQIIFTRGDWAIVSYRISAIGVIGFIEIQYQDTVLYIVYRAVDVTASAITVDTAGRISEGNEEIVARSCFLH